MQAKLSNRCDFSSSGSDSGVCNTHNVLIDEERFIDLFPYLVSVQVRLRIPQNKKSCRFSVLRCHESPSPTAAAPTAAPPAEPPSRILQDTSREPNGGGPPGGGIGSAGGVAGVPPRILQNTTRE